MPREINLLPEEIIKGKKKESLRRWAQAISLVVLISAIVTVAAAVIYRITLDTQIKDLDNEINTKRNTVSSKQKLENQTVIVSEKLNSIGKIREEDPKYLQTIQLLQSLMPQGVTMKGFKINEIYSFTTSATASSSGALEEFINNLNSQDSKNKFNRVVLKSIQGNSKDKKYDFNLELSFTPKNPGGTK